MFVMSSGVGLTGEKQVPPCSLRSRVGMTAVLLGLGVRSRVGMTSVFVCNQAAGKSYIGPSAQKARFRMTTNT